MTDLQPTQGSGSTAKVLGFVVLGLGCSMGLAALAPQIPISLPQRLALGLLGAFGCYWGMRFQRLGRRQSRGSDYGSD